MFLWVGILFVSIVHAHDPISDPKFDSLVNQGAYQEALNFTCSKYNFDCAHVYLWDTDVSGSGEQAMTDSLNRAWIPRNAFRYNGQPNVGWLGAVVGHELVHTRQSLSLRSYNHLMMTFGNYSTDAILETEAWLYMLQNSKLFQLSCFMQLGIRRNLYYYKKILDFNGRAPANEDDEQNNYSLPASLERQYMDECRRGSGE